MLKAGKPMMGHFSNVADLVGSSLRGLGNKSNCIGSIVMCAISKVQSKLQSADGTIEIDRLHVVPF